MYELSDFDLKVSPLDFAVSWGNIEIAGALLKLGCNPLGSYRSGTISRGILFLTPCMVRGFRVVL